MITSCEMIKSKIMIKPGVDFYKIIFPPNFFFRSRATTTRMIKVSSESEQSTATPASSCEYDYFSRASSAEQNKLLKSSKKILSHVSSLVLLRAIIYDTFMSLL